MINRINLILRAKNITARQFAEEIGIQPSGMSHILGGRNNPSLDFAIKVLRRYPEIDANWLLLGKGAMYGNTEPRFNEPACQNQAEVETPKLFDDNLFSQHQEDVKPYEEHEEPHPKVEEYQATYVAVPPKEVESTTLPPSMVDEGESPSSVRNSVDVQRILFIYSDNTYEILTPRR